MIELQVCPRRDVLSRIMSKSWLTSLLSHLIILHHLSKYLLSGFPTYSRFPVLLHSNLSWSRSAGKSPKPLQTLFLMTPKNTTLLKNEKNCEVVVARWYLNQTCVRNWSSTRLREHTTERKNREWNRHLRSQSSNFGMSKLFYCRNLNHCSRRSRWQRCAIGEVPRDGSCKSNGELKEIVSSIPARKDDEVVIVRGH